MGVDARRRARGASARMGRMAAAASNLTWSGAWDWFVGVPLTIVLIMLAAFLSRWMIHRAIDKFVQAAINRKDAQKAGAVDTAALPLVRRQARRAARVLTRSGLIDQDRHDRRVTTLGSVLRNCASVVIWSVAALLVLDQLHINLAPLLASAGVGGIAVAFGAQSLVKDFLSGIFMLAEDQYGVGDFIDTGEASGTVEEVTLRVTRLRDAQGVIWYVRNGEIVRVANKSQGWSTALVDIPVSALESPQRVIDVLTAAMADLDADPDLDDVLLSEPEVVGVEAATGGAMSIRVIAKCAPNEHWGVQREIRERALMACAAAGIKPPPSFPPYGGASPS